MLFDRFTDKMQFLFILIFCNIGFVVFYLYTIPNEKSPVLLSPSPSRVLIFTSDNRPIVNGNNYFFTLSALINFLYAQRHGYTYRYYQITYNDTRKLSKKIPFSPGCFNLVLNQERSAHWAKLQVMLFKIQYHSYLHCFSGHLACFRDIFVRI